jgi:hypothetical protein
MIVIFWGYPARSAPDKHCLAVVADANLGIRTVDFFSDDYLTR